MQLMFPKKVKKWQINVGEKATLMLLYILQSHLIHCLISVRKQPALEVN